MGRSLIQGGAHRASGGSFRDGFRIAGIMEGLSWGMDLWVEARFNYEVGREDLQDLGKRYDANQLRDPTWGGPTEPATFDKPKNIEAVRNIDANNFGRPLEGLEFSGFWGGVDYHLSREGGWLSRQMVRIPGMHQVSIYHDYMAATFVSDSSGFFGKIKLAAGSWGTMVPSAALTYGRLYYESSPFIPHYGD